MTNRTIQESPITQGEDEVIVYTLTTTPWGSTPTDIQVVVFDITDSTWTDVTATVMPTNTPTVNGDIITMSPLLGLTDGHKYRMEIQFTCGANQFEANCLFFGGE